MFDQDVCNCKSLPGLFSVTIMDLSLWNLNLLVRQKFRTFLHGTNLAPLSHASGSFRAEQTGSAVPIV